MALKFALAPDKKMLLAASGGFNDTGLTLFDIAGKRVGQFLPLPEVWNGLAFSKDGRRIFVSGGDSGVIHVFTYADGKATPAEPVKPAPEALATVLGGIAVHPRTGKLYVCNEGNHEVWALNPDTLALEAKVGVGQHPHSCVMGRTISIFTSAIGAAAASALLIPKRTSACATSRSACARTT